MSWLPTTVLEVVVLVLGCLIGLIFAFSAWRGSTKDTPLKEDPRIKALLWGLGGLLVTLLGDWDGLLKGSTIDKPRLLSFYASGFLGVAIIAITSTAGVILVRSWWERRTNPSEYPEQPFHPVIDYLSYGYQYYMKEYQEAVIRKRARDSVIFKDFMGHYAVILAAHVALVGRYLDSPTPEVRKDSCKRLLEQICMVAEPYLKEGHEYYANANYMVAVPYKDTTEEERKSLHFGWGDPSRYSHLLILEDYAYPGTTAPGKFALPVEDPEKTNDYLELTLPGAPEAFLRKDALAVGGNISFDKRVPVEIQEKIKQYLARQKFTCFISLIIPGPGDYMPIGVVNIETNHQKILQAKEETRTELAKILQPFCMLLGVVLVKGKRR